MFKLSRYFSITSLIAFVGVTILLSFLYPQIILNDLTAIAESKNVAITQGFANSVWPDFATFVTSASELPPGQERSRQGQYLLLWFNLTNLKHKRRADTVAQKAEHGGDWLSRRAAQNISRGWQTRKPSGII